MRKILSIVLVITLVLSSFSFAFAKKGSAISDIADTDYEEAVSTLMGFGIINGYPDGTYKPGNVVTRAEMAKLLVITLGYGDLAGGSSSFSDMAGHWADGFVALATGLDIVKGYPDGTFKPDAPVTYDEAITMIIRGLGYTDESLPGVWPTDYKIKALELGILDDVTVAAGGANRGDVAIMLFNALDAEYGQVNADDVWEANNDGKTLLDKLGTKIEEYQITYKNVYGDGIAHEADEDDYWESDDGMDEMSDMMLKSAIDLSEDMFHVVDMYMNDDDEVVYISDYYTEREGGDVSGDLSGGYMFAEDQPEEGDPVYDADDTLAVTLTKDDEVRGEAIIGTDALLMFNNYEVINDLTPREEYAKTGGRRSGHDAYPGLRFMGEPNAGRKKAGAIYYYDENDDGELDEGDKVVAYTVRGNDFYVVADAYDEDDDYIKIMNSDWEGDEDDSAQWDEYPLPLDEDGEVDFTKLYSDDTDNPEELVMNLQKGDTITTLRNAWMGADLVDDDDARMKINSGRNVVTGVIAELDDPVEGYHSTDQLTLTDGTVLTYFENFSPNGTDFIDALDDGSEVTFYCLSGGAILRYDFVESPKDYAIYIGGINQGTDAYGTAELGEAKLLTASGDQIIYDVEEDMDMADGLEDIASGSLIEYSLNGDGEVDSIEVVIEFTGAGDDLSYNEDIGLIDGPEDGYLADNVIIFDLTEYVSELEMNAGDWDVFSVADLGSDLNGLVLFDDDEDVEVLVILESTGDVDEEYALAVSTTKVLDDGDLVDKVNLYREGVMETLYTDAAGEIVVGADDDKQTVNMLQFGIVTLDSSDVIEDNTMTDVLAVHKAIEDVRSNSIKIDGTIYELSADLVIYEITADYDEPGDEYRLSVEVIDFDDVTEDMVVDMVMEIDEEEMEVVTMVVADTEDDDTADWLDIASMLYAPPAGPDAASLSLRLDTVDDVEVPVIVGTDATMEYNRGNTTVEEARSWRPCEEGETEVAETKRQDTGYWVRYAATETAPASDAVFLDYADATTGGGSTSGETFELTDVVFNEANTQLLNTMATMSYRRAGKGGSDWIAASDGTTDLDESVLPIDITKTYQIIWTSDLGAENEADLRVSIYPTGATVE